MPRHSSLNITDEQEANLRKLADYLRTLPADYPDFAMSLFSRDEKGASWDSAHLPECGTAACAAGHGPAAGIPPEPGETWGHYSERAFVEDLNGWCWCFTYTWADVDNTAHGAAARIEWMLEDGVPEDAHAQSEGRAPLSYVVAA